MPKLPRSTSSPTSSMASGTIPSRPAKPHPDRLKIMHLFPDRSLARRKQGSVLDLSRAVSPVSRPTLVDIAKASGVSRATVSLVLRNNPSIPERTRERVLLAAKQLGYVYNRGAASLRSSHTRLIAMAVNDLTNPYFAEIVAAIEDALTAE